MRRRTILTVLALSVTATLMGAPAGAVHWPNAGGDPGRSGAQPVDQGGLPVQFLYSRTGLADRDVRTSLVTTGGSSSVQRLVYGTEDGFILLRVLFTGAPVGPAGGTDLGAAAFPFGSSGSASFVSSSSDDALGQVYSVHNELYEDASIGLELAQIDEASGERARKDVALAGTGGYRIQSSPLLTPPDAAGNRSLFFVAGQQDGPDQRLFKVAIANAASTQAGIGPAVATADVNANPEASPTLVHLRNAAGAPTAYVAVSTFNGMSTFAVSDLSPGPSSSGIGEAVRTPSTPVTGSGAPPGATGSGVSVTPAIYAASGASGAGATTTLHRFTQSGSDQELVRVSSGRLSGAAAPGLAIAVDGEQALVATSTNLYGLRTSDLGLAARFSGGDLAAGSTGFSRTVPVTTGDLVIIVSDGGGQFVLDRGSLQPIDADLFEPPRTAEGATFAIGQPAISRRFLQIATDRGIFVYGLRRASPPSGYWLAASDGGIFTYGDAGFFGSTGDLVLNKPIVTMAATPTREGYWLAASDGGIFNFGDAAFLGSTGDLVLNSPVVAMAPTRSGLGYWLVAADGGVFTFGDAKFLGSTGDIALNKPIVGMAVTPAGDGYWLVASDGGIFAFGEAPFLGSTGDISLNKPIVGMAGLPAGSGYWLVASDGGVFSFGRAAFFGSTGDIVLNSPIVGLTPSATGSGYLFTAADGGVFVFGDAPFLGAAAELGTLNRPVTTIAAKP